MEGKEKMEGYRRFLRKRIAVFYQDSPEHVSRKDGELISVDNDSITLLSFNSELLIPKNKIVRVEV